MLRPAARAAAAEDERHGARKEHGPPLGAARDGPRALRRRRPPVLALGGHHPMTIPEPVQDWEARCALGRRVAENAQSHVRLCTRLKAAASLPIKIAPIVPLSCFFYLCSLAESRGFAKIRGILEKVWERTTVGMDKTEWGVDGMLQQLTRVLENPNFAFRYIEGFPGPRFFPGSPGSFSIVFQLYTSDTYSNTEAMHRFGVAAEDLVGAEALSTLFFLSFAEILHRPGFAAWAAMSIPTLQLEFRDVLDTTIP